MLLLGPEVANLDDLTFQKSLFEVYRSFETESQDLESCIDGIYSGSGLGFNVGFKSFDEHEFSFNRAGSLEYIADKGFFD